MRYHLRRFSALAALIAVAVFSSCGDAPTGPEGVDVQLAKGGPGPKVNEADPNIAPQDTTLDVRVIGTGFDDGSVAQFLLAGQSSPKVVTNATTFVDDTNLIANVTISLDADVALYDVEVTTSRGKKGIGSELFSVVQKGGQGDPPGPTPVSVVLGIGTIDGDGNGAYVDGQPGVEAFISDGGALRLLPSDPRAFDIGEIRDSGGALLVAETGLTGGVIQTLGCCDLLNMTSDSAGVVVSGTSIPVKLRVRWDVSDGVYRIAMGANNGCIDPGPGGTPPDDHPGRGTWARATRTSPTTWTIESVGPAAVCRFIDERGRKNDRYELVSTDAVVNLTMFVTELP